MSESCPGLAWVASAAFPVWFSTWTAAHRLLAPGVIRALLAWGLFSFAVLQVIEPVLHALHLPDGALTGVVAVLALGFPATVVPAWFFDLSRAGITRTPDTPAGEGGGTAPAQRVASLFAGLVAAGALAGAGVGPDQRRGKGPRPKRPPAPVGIGAARRRHSRTSWPEHR